MCNSIVETKNQKRKMFFDKKKISFLGLLVTIVLLIAVFGIILSVAERDPSEEHST